MIAAPNSETFVQTNGTTPPRARCVWCGKRIYRTAFGWLHAGIKLRDDPGVCR